MELGQLQKFKKFTHMSEFAFVVATITNNISKRRYSEMAYLLSFF